MQKLSRLAVLMMMAGLVACSVKPVTYTGLDAGDDTGSGDGGIGASAPVLLAGTVTGLAGSGLVLANGGDTVAVVENGGFTFPTKLNRGDSYLVTVQTQPTGPIQTCSVANASGVADRTDIGNVAVTCSTTAFTVGGTVEGLAGTGLMLQDNGGDTLAVTANGAFTFAAPVASGGHYAIEVVAQPGMPTQACTVTGGSGDVVDANITTVSISCQTRSFTVGGTVTGLAGTGLVLKNNGGDALPISANGAFTFATPVLSGADYAVTVVQQPSNPTQTCTVSGGTGTVGGSDVTSVTVNCSTRKFTIGGTVTGLAGTGLVLQDNGGDDLAISGNGSFAFATPIASNATYAVTVKTSPLGPSQTCTVTNASGTVTNANVTSVAVSCTTNAFTIGGTVTGLASGDSLTLRDNGGDALAITGNGSFTFATKVLSGASYAVTTTSPASPIAQTCTVTNASGMVGNTNVTNVAVACVNRTLTIGGVARGVIAAGLVLHDNAGDDLAVSASGAFTFSKPIASGATYAVTIKSSPANTSCSLWRATGTVGSVDVTSVVVSCVPPWTTGVFPVSITGVTNAIGDIAFDGNGDLLVAQAFTRTLWRVSRTTGAASVVASNIGGSSDYLVGVAYHPVTDTIYVSTLQGVYELVAGAANQIATVPNINAITVAPDSYAPYGEWLIGATQGQVVAINPASHALVTIASPGNASDLAFAPDGTLYTSGGTMVTKVSASGSFAPVVSTGLGSADGITITPDGTTMYIADSGASSVVKIALPGLAVSTFQTNVAIDGGYGVGGILAAPGKTLIVLTNGSNANGQLDLLRAFAD